jgi:pyruvate ferredoxin oxidoreductase alpha subunit/phenylglyoxylate dehydrogenase alpha subunit
VRYRKGQCSGTQNALKVITEVHEEWGRRFGRYHAPLVESYRMDGADYAIMTIGSMTGAAKDAIDEARARGDKVGLVKVKTYRPFPAQALVSALAAVKAVGVVDRSVSFGWNCGPLFQDTITAMYYTPKRIPAISFIGGLAGADLTVGHFERVIRRTAELARDGRPAETVWLNEKD